MKKTFYSNGKLLLTGEYLVLDGATALAVPTKFGQSLEITESEEKGLHWQSIDSEAKIWFEARFYIKGNTIFSIKTPNAVQDQLLRILQAAKTLNPDFLKENENLNIKTYLDFHRGWGLGTSSTLINNIAQWSKTDSYVLLNTSFGGSGYDIAAARHNSPILYSLVDSKPKVKEVNLEWSFKEELFFIYLNRKQDSQKEIMRYREFPTTKGELDAISKISNAIISVKTRSEFEDLINEHETIISRAIGLSPVKEQLFRDYPHAIKSLGAWGGDFVLACGTKKDIEYFKAKGYDDIHSFNKMLK